MSKLAGLLAGLLAAIGGAALLCSLRAVPARSSTAQSPHLYVSWDRFELDRCVAAWLIKRHLDPDAEFALYPVGTTLPVDGCVAFDAPGAHYERKPSRTVSEAVLAEIGVQDPVIDRIISIVRAAELAYWMLEPSSNEARLRDTLQLHWTQHADVADRLQAIFTTLDEVYWAGGLAP